MSRIILHLDLDTFFVSCERLQRPELIGKPVIVGGNGDERGVVAACSYEARKFGVHSAMPLKWAKNACPEAIFIRGSMSLYADYSRQVTDVVRDFSPRFEKASIDEFYIDISGLYKYIFQSPVEAASWLRHEIDRKCGLPSSCGIGQNRLMAKIGSKLAKPAGIFFIPPGSEPELLAPLPADIIPGVGDSTLDVLKKFGVKTVGDIQKLSQTQLEKSLGKAGLDLFKKARGIGSELIETEYERKSVSSELTFSEDTYDPVNLRDQLVKCAQEVGYSLRNQKFKSATLTLKLRDHTFKTHTYSETYPFPVNDDHNLINRAMELFEKAWKPSVKIRLIGFGSSKLEPADLGPQDLFESESTEKVDRLFSKVDDLKRRFGKHSLEIAGFSAKKK